MSKSKQKRVPKSRKEIVSDIQLVQDAERRRSLIKETLFPYLVEMNETIRYSKTFMQAFSGLVNGVFEEQAKKTTIGHLTPRIKERLKEIFKVSEPEQAKEYEKYVNLVDKLHDVSVQDLAYATELPRYIDGFILQNNDKESISTIPIDKILG